MRELSLDVVITSIKDPVHKTGSAGRTTTYQYFEARQHGQDKHATPTPFQLKGKYTVMIAKYAPGDHVRLFFQIDNFRTGTGVIISFHNVFKIERTNPPSFTERREALENGGSNV